MEARGLLGIALALVGLMLLYGVLLGVLLVVRPIDVPSVGVALLGVRAILCVGVLGAAWGFTRRPR